MKSKRYKIMTTLVLAAGTASVGCGKLDPSRGAATSAPSTAGAPGTGLPTGAGGTDATAHVFVPSEPPEVRLKSELATAAKVDSVTAARMAGISPVLKCVETLPDDKLRAHFGFDNQMRGEGGKRTSVPVGFYNRLWPPPIEQGQPTTFDLGRREDAAQIVFAKEASVAWVLGAHFSLATASSPRCPSKSPATSILARGERSPSRRALAKP